MLMEKKITLVIVGGIRTHYIKINAIQKVIKNLDINTTKKFEFIFIDVAQHYDKTLTGFIDELDIHFDYRLQHESTDSFKRLSSIFTKLGSTLDEISLKRKIDYIIVMGDVATTAITSLVAIAKQIKLIHIEGGVRIGRGNGTEEYFRTAADHLSTICFAATKMDYDNLINEGLGKRASFSGDIIYDYIKLIKQDFSLKQFMYFTESGIESFLCDKSDYILTSLHHIENLDKNVLQSLFCAIEEFGIRSIFIAHPRVYRLIIENNINTYSTIIAKGVPYLENLRAIKQCRFVITDSGGIQREAYYFNKRCIVRSDLTIWRPIVEIGSNITVGKDKNELVNAMKWAEKNHNAVIPYDNCFGEGDAVKSILKKILKEENL